MNYWLFKTEPAECSIDDLQALKGKSQYWNGIRNYQARNILRDQVKPNDKVFIYHSSCKEIGVAGIAMVTSNAYPDPDQFNPESKYFDPKSSPEAPRWCCVDVCYEAHFKPIIPLSVIKNTAELSQMVLIRQSRLSIQPVSASEWFFLNTLAKKISGVETP